MKAKPISTAVVFIAAVQVFAVQNINDSGQDPVNGEKQTFSDSVKANHGDILKDSSDLSETPKIVFTRENYPNPF